MYLVSNSELYLYYIPAFVITGSTCFSTIIILDHLIDDELPETFTEMVFDLLGSIH